MVLAVSVVVAPQVAAVVESFEPSGRDYQRAPEEDRKILSFLPKKPCDCSWWRNCWPGMANANESSSSKTRKDHLALYSY